MSSDDQDLDDLLESALDDFKHVDINRASSSDTNNQASIPDGTQSLLSSSVWQVPEESISPQPGGEGSGASSSSQSLPVRGLGLGLSGLQPMKKKKEVSSKSKPKGDKRGDNDRGVGQLQKSLSSTLDKLAEQTQQTVHNMDLGEEEDSLNGVADKLVQQLEALGGTEDVQSLMDNMMRQLLSKEVLHEPMQEIGDRYPLWLEANRSSLSQEDFDRYTQQHKYIRDLCRVYESTPNDFEQIVDLMQQMQKCGQPPADIIKELAPGVKLGEDGLPILEDSTPGAEGFPPNCGMM